MRKIVTTCTILFLTSMTVGLAADSSTAKEKWVKCWVSDSKCGAKGAAPGHADCGQKCLAAGEHVVFVSTIRRS